jgi:predicted enzyme involved in methoxymalonyl-ACP biosynthesis
MGARGLRGVYLPTKKNAMVRDHYTKLGFTVTQQQDDGASQAELDLMQYEPPATFIQVSEG